MMKMDIISEIFFKIKINTSSILFILIIILFIYLFAIITSDMIIYTVSFFFYLILLFPLYIFLIQLERLVSFLGFDKIMIFKFISILPQIIVAYIGIILFIGLIWSYLFT